MYYLLQNQTLTTSFSIDSESPILLKKEDKIRFSLVKQALHVDVFVNFVTIVGNGHR